MERESIYFEPSLFKVERSASKKNLGAAKFRITFVLAQISLLQNGTWFKNGSAFNFNP